MKAARKATTGTRATRADSAPAPVTDREPADVRGGDRRKAAQAFRTIAEVSDELAIAKHVLRFWELKFSQVRPMKRGGGRRFYRPDDVELLRGIRHLLQAEAFTIKGVQKILREQGPEAVKRVGVEAGEPRTREATRRTSKGKRAGAVAEISVLPVARGTTGQPAATRDLETALRAAITQLEDLRALLSGGGKAGRSAVPDRR